MGFVSQVITNATEYLGYAPKQLTVDMAIEIFADLRRYPSDYTADMILDDKELNIAKISMAVVELDAKIGIEGQISHSENGMARNYGSLLNPKAYANVVQIAHY